jgi:hypothetical protein
MTLLKTGSCQIFFNTEGLLSNSGIRKPAADTMPMISYGRRTFAPQEREKPLFQTQRTLVSYL